jgi:hypothetical protein
MVLGFAFPATGEIGGGGHGCYSCWGIVFGREEVGDGDLEICCDGQFLCFDGFREGGVA